jgi:hypothetical protein
MGTDIQTFEKIFNQVKQLPPDYRLRLVQRIIQTLISSPPPQQPHFIRFGEFSGDEAAMSTWEDFALAEWRPNDEELNGS